MPKSAKMQKNPHKYQNNPNFQEFLNREFDHTAVDATMEELAEFAFGSLDKAIKAYEDNRRKMEDRKK